MIEHKDGKTLNTAYIITDSNGEITKSIIEIIETRFGGKDGSYFIHNETTQENTNTRKRYKVFFIEDCKEQYHTIYFEIGELQ